jgi:glycosyltransferase involved in cell wall biosynthesis
VSYIGALERIKGVEQVIRAFTKITGATLLIFGDGSDRKRLEKIAGNNVIFKGKVAYENIPSIYRQSSLIVIPGLWPEPFPRTILESTYFGKPIVASDVGGNSEGVDDGKNGYLIQNESEWHKRLQELIDDATKRKRMGKRSKEIYKRRFSTEKQIAKIITDYKR